VRVTGVTGNVLTLAEPTKSTYGTTQSGLAYGEGNAVNCEIRDLQVKSDAVGDAYQYVIRSGVNVRLQNITLIGTRACGAATFCKGLVYENFVATTNGGGPDHGRGCESVTWNNASITLHAADTNGSYVEESFYNITFNDYKIFGGGFGAGNLGITSTQRPRKLTYLNCFADAALYGTANSPFGLSGVPNIEVSVANCTFKGSVTTPYATNFPSITGQALVWVSSNNAGNVVNFANCRFISTNSGNTWPSAIGGFLGDVLFDNLCSFDTCTPPSQVAVVLKTGTWTPTAYGATTAGTITLTQQSGNYARVGNLVTASFALAWNSATGTGDILIEGLPYASKSGSVGATLAIDGTAAIANAFAVAPVAGTTRLYCYKALAATGSAIGTITYQV
jgi:hypothetical protein